MTVPTERNVLHRLCMAGSVLLLWSFVRAHAARVSKHSAIALCSEGGYSAERCGDEPITTGQLRATGLLSEANIVHIEGRLDAGSLSSTEDGIDSHNSIAARAVVSCVNLAGHQNGRHLVTADIYTLIDNTTIEYIFPQFTQPSGSIDPEGCSFGHVHKL
jgi:hypothetical protein